MEAQLQGLIDKIKKDGISEAETQAAAIISDAKKRADKVVAEANEKAKEIVKKAGNDAAQAEEAGKRALEQAGRNLLLGLRKNIEEILGRVTQQSIADSLSADIMGKMLEKIVANWDRTQPAGKGLDVLLSPGDAESMAKGILENLQKQMKQGVELKPVESVDAGFRIGEKGGSMHYDFTEKGLAEIVSQYVNPKLAEILNSK